MKKTVISILLACLTLSMAACGSTETSPDSPVESPAKPGEVLIESGDSVSIVEEPAENRNEFVPAQYEVGDIILADGSIVKITDLII